MKLLKICAFLLAVFNTQADILISTDGLSEHYDESIKVSSDGYLFGLQLSGDDPNKDLYLLFPQDSTGRLCISLSSIDGKYKAKIEHDLVDAVSGKTKIIFPTQFGSDIDGYKSEEIAVSAQLGKSCDSPNDRLLLASWGEDVSNEIIVLIRSDAKIDTLHIPSIQDSEFSATCKKFRDADTVTYDKFCIVPTNGKELSSVEIQRINLRREMPSKIIQIAN